MPRRARLAIAGIPWHIIQRGNNRSACFYAESDYCVYLDTLLEQSVRWRCAIHAYVLKTNHVHLLLTPETCDGPAGLMKHLGQRYVQYVNRSYQRTGTLREGRYRSCLAQSGNYVLTCSRYIELNPVRAGMVNDPAEYRWSSYRTNAMGLHSRLLQPHQDWLALGGTDSARATAYRQLFADALRRTQLDEIRTATNGGYVLGNQRFAQEIETMLNRRVVPGRPGRRAKREKTKTF